MIGFGGGQRRGGGYNNNNNNGGNNQRYGGRGGFNGNNNMGPPDQVVVMGEFMHACEGERVCKSTNEKIPYFNAFIYLENKTQIGKVDEILGPINEVVSQAPNNLM